MDFSSALANLEKTANAAANSRPRDDRRRPRSDSGDFRRNRNQRSRHHEQRREQYSARPLENMTRFGYRISPFHPPTNPPEDLYERPFHIALLCISIDDLPYESIWREWVKTGKAHVSLYCHAKYPDKVQSEWLKQRIITKPPRLGRGNTYADPEYICHRPNWGSVQITRAMIDLLTIAMKTGIPMDKETDPRFCSKKYYMIDETPEALPPVDKFIFISETCLPVCTLKECEKALFGEKKEGAIPPDWQVSWVNARNRDTPGTPRNKYEGDQFSGIHRMIPQQYRWKADQWLSLSRPHAAAVFDIDGHMRLPDKLWNSFAKINASDEMYFPTALALLGILTKPNNATQVAVRPITYTDWTQGMRNPASYSRGLEDFRRIAKLSRAQGSLFARKFVPVLEIPGEETQRTGNISADDWAKDVNSMVEQVPIMYDDEQVTSIESKEVTDTLTPENNAE